MFPNYFKPFIAAAAFAAISMPAFAAPIIANTGWIEDSLRAANQPTGGSPFTFTLSAGQTASFKLTDQFIVGDSFQLFSGTDLLMSSSAYAGVANAIIGDFYGEQGWLSAAYEKIDYVFSGAGTYSFNIVGDGVGGVPAGLYVRLDVIDASDVPEPASIAMLGLGLAALSAMRRRPS